MGRRGFLLQVEGEELLVLSHELPAQVARRISAWTETEREVVALALAGLSNRAIARQRNTSANTVANQLKAAYAKVGVSSRVELSALLAAKGAQGDSADT